MKKFLWKFGKKKIDNKYIPVIYTNYEYNGELPQTSPNWLRLDKSYHWKVFQAVILRNIGNDYEITYSGKMSKKFMMAWLEFKNSIEEFCTMEKTKSPNEKQIQYNFPFHMVELNQSPKLSEIFEKLENLRYIH